MSTRVQCSCAVLEYRVNVWSFADSTHCLSYAGQHLSSPPPSPIFFHTFVTQSYFYIFKICIHQGFFFVPYNPMGIDKFIVSCIHHHSIMQDTFHCPKKSTVLHLFKYHLSFYTRSLANTDIFVVL